MPIISDGTVTVTNRSKTITFAGGKLLDKGVKAGAWFKLDGEETKYHFEITPTDNTTGQLVETYGGVTQGIAIRPYYYMIFLCTFRGHFYIHSVAKFSSDLPLDILELNGNPLGDTGLLAW